MPYFLSPGRPGSQTLIPNPGNIKMLRTLIIDDEAHIRNTLSRMLAKYCPLVEVSGEADGVSNGISIIRSQQPDLVFLDFHLQDGNAFDLLEQINPIDFRLVFISSFDKSSIQAFRQSGLDFLQKPFNPFELKQAVNEASDKELKDIKRRLNMLRHELKSTAGT